MKKYCSIVALLMAIIMIFSAISVSSVSADYQLGDPAKTGKPGGLKNIKWMQNHLTKNGFNQGVGSVLYADVYEDSVIDAKDFTVFRMYEAGLIESFPYVPRTTVETSDSGDSGITTNPNAPAGVDPNYPEDLAMLRTLKANNRDNGYYSVLVNQVGYSTNAKKIVRITEGANIRKNSTQSLIYNKKVYVVNTATNTCVGTFDIGREKNFSQAINNTDEMYIAEVDISSITKEGTYVIYSPIGKSYEFEIKANGNEKAMNDALLALYYNRCGGDISEETLKAYDKYLVDNFGYKEGEYYNNYKCYIRDACHVKSQNKNIGQEVEIVDTFNSETGKFETNKDSNGNVIRYPAADFAYGLHDAGDYARYTLPGAQTLSDLIYAYMLYPDVFTLDVIKDEAIDPNGDKNVPDILDIARWEAKFLLNMQSKSSWSKGGFYLKIATDVFASANGTLPESDSGFNGDYGKYKNYPGLRVQQVNLSTTAACSAVLADCYTVFKDIDPKFAQQCLTAAKAGFEYYDANINSDTKEAKARNDGINNNDTDYIGGGTYIGNDSSKNNWWHMYAALYRATGESIYNNKIKSKIDGTYDITTQAGYGYVAYYLAYSEDKLESADAEVAQKCLEKFTTTSASYIKTVNNDECGIFPSCYKLWGSNGGMCYRFSVLSVSNAFKKYNISDTTDYITPNRIGANYFFGVNVLGYCFITGWDYPKATQNIHHFPSVILQNRNNTTTGRRNRCVPGWLAEGYSSNTGPFNYQDSQDDYVTNEVVIYGNAALLLTLAPVVREDKEINK